MDLLVMFGELKTKINFLVVDGVPVGVLIGFPEMEKLSAKIDLKGQYVDFAISRKSVQASLEPDHSLNEPAGDESKEEDLTTDSRDKSSVDESHNDCEKRMVVVMAVKDGGLQSQNELTKKEELQ